MKYPEDIKEEMITEYLNGVTAEELAARYDAKERSIIAVLSRAGVYKKKTYQPKYGLTPHTKEQLVQLIEASANEVAGTYDGLEKAPKFVLLRLLSIINEKSQSY